MIRILDNLSIGKKTVGFITLLLAIMLGISVYSFHRIRIASDEAVDLSEWITPLNDALNSIEVHSLAEGIHLQRSLRYYGGQAAPQATLNRELASLRSRQKAIAQEVTAVKSSINKALVSVKLPEDGVIIGQFKVLLHNFENKHAQFNVLANKTLTALERRDLKTATVLEKQLHAEQEQLDQLTEDIRVQVVKLTEKRSQQFVKDEKAVVWLSLESLIIAAIAFLLGVLVTIIITRRLVGYVRQILNCADDISRGDLNVSVPVSSKDEIGMLAVSFNHMIEELKHKELIKSTFGEYIDPRVVETLLKQNNLDANTGERRVMTVFFSDMAGFTSIAEVLTPMGLVKLMNEYFTLAAEPIQRHKGVLEKYIGDAIMSFWGPPFVDASEHAKLACRASLQQFEQVEKLERALPDLLNIRHGLPKISIRIGICTGEVVVGSIGPKRSRTYGIVGDTVNIAARLEGANKQYGTRILISHETYVMVKDEFETREIDIIIVVGKSHPVQVYELLGEKGQLDPQMIELKKRFEQGLSLYRTSNWQAAEEAFVSALELNPLDGPSQIFLERIRLLKEAPPATNWDGVWRLTTK